MAPKASKSQKKLASIVDNKLNFLIGDNVLFTKDNKTLDSDQLNKIRENRKPEITADLDTLDKKHSKKP